MLFFPNVVWRLTLCVSISLFSFSFNSAFAGGDPSVKDTKVIEKKSNIIF